MNDDRRRLLTEYIGEVWVEHDNPNQQIYVGKDRTFTAWPDLGTVKERLKERGDWLDFMRFAIQKYTGANSGRIIDFLDYIFNPVNFCELAAEFLEGRK